MAAPTPKNPSTTKATQTNMALSFTTANPDGYPISYADDVWDAVEQNTAMSDVMEGTGQYDQKTINEQLAGKIGSIDLSVFEKVINKVISISAQSTDTQYPTAKLLYDSLQALANVYAAKANTYTKTEVDNLISSISTLSFVVVDTLPTTDIQTNVIYLVPSPTAQQQNIYDEYIYSNNEWEHIGSTAVDLSGYELKINKVTSISAQSTDNQYPSAKLLYDSLQALSNVFARIADLASVAFSGSYNDLSNKPTIPAAQVNSDWNSNSGVSQILNKPNVEIQENKVTVLSPQNTDAQYPSAKAVYDCCAEVKEFLENLDERVTRLEGFHYMITGASLQGTIVIELNGELLAYQVGSDHTYEFKYKEPIQTLDFRAANIVSVSFNDSDSLIGLVSCDELFKNCVELIAVDFSNKTFASVVSAVDMFSGCVSLTTLTCPDTESWKPDLDFSDCEELTQASLESLIDDFLFTYSSGDHIITPNQIMWGRISHADQDSIIARATAKGWQLNVGSRYNISGTSNGSIVNITVDGTAVTVPVENGVWNYSYDDTLSSISFANDTHVQTIDFSLSDGLSGITSLASAFNGCTALTSIVFTDCDLSNIIAASGAFDSCLALANLTIPNGAWKPDVSFEDSPLITYAEMLDIVNGLYNYTTGTHTITFNSSTWENLTETQRTTIFNACSGKNWECNAIQIIYYIEGTSTATIFHIRGTVTSGTSEITLKINNVNVVVPCVNDEFDYEYDEPITSLYQFAYNNTSLVTIDFSQSCLLTDTTTMQYAFQNCTSLTSAIFTNVKFESLTTAKQMFQNCTSLSAVDIADAIMPLCTTTEAMYQNCTSLVEVDMSSATFESLKLAGGSYLGMFSGCTNLERFITNSVFPVCETYMDMFLDCGKLAYPFKSTMTFAKAKTMYRAFYNCTSMAFDFSEALFTDCTDMRIFDGITADIYMPKATFYNATQVNFGTTGNINLPVANPLNFSNLRGAFSICKSLSMPMYAAELGNTYPFYRWTNCEYINLPLVTNENYINVGSFLRDCPKLETCYLNSITFRNATTMGAQGGLNLLKELRYAESSTLQVSISFSNSPQFSYDSMLSVVKTLANVATTQTLTLNSTAWSALTSAQQNTLTTTATAKNWNIVH